MSTHRIHQLGEAISRTLEAIVSVCLAIILVTTILLVTLRYGFNSGIKGADEMANYLFIYMTALGAPAAVFRSEHIALTALIERAPRKLHRIIDILIQLLIILVNAVILAYSFSWIAGVGSFVSPVLRIPNRFIQVSVPIGGIATILICTINILRVGFENEIVTTGESNVGLAD